MLEWKRVQLMITNYIVMDEEFNSKMLDVCAGKQIITWSPALNISVMQRVQPPNVTQCRWQPSKSYVLTVYITGNHFPIHASGAVIVNFSSRGPLVSVHFSTLSKSTHRALKLAQHSKCIIMKHTPSPVLLNFRVLIVSKWRSDLCILPGGAFSEGLTTELCHSAATQHCVHKLWCLETQQGMQMIIRCWCSRNISGSEWSAKLISSKIPSVRQHTVKTLLPFLITHLCEAYSFMSATKNMTLE